MSHPEQRQFCQHCKEKFPEYFSGVRVIDVGSLDINGSNRNLFSDLDGKCCNYVGLDLSDGPNVSITGKCHEVNIQSESFDVVISTEMLEHDMYWRESLLAMCRWLRAGGLLVFTCATTGRAEHGTVKSFPCDSPFTSSTQNEWKDYYLNLTEQDIRSVLNVDLIFERFEFGVNRCSCDLRFWGIKR